MGSNPTPSSDVVDATGAIAGGLAEASGIRALFTAVGAAFILVLVAILPLPVLRELDRPRSARDLARGDER